MEWIRLRKQYWGELRRHPWLVAANFVAMSFNVFTAIRDNFLSPKWKERLDMVPIANLLPWYWWTIIFLILLAVTIFESGYRNHAQLKAERAVPLIATAASASAAPSKIGSDNTTSQQNTFAPIIQIPPYPVPPSPTPPPPSPVRKPPEEKYNFVVDDICTRVTLEDDGDFKIVQMPQYYRGFGRTRTTWLLELTNRAHKDFRPSYAHNVIAELHFSEELIVGPLIWIGQGAEVNFSIGHPETVVLAVREGSAWCLPRYKPIRTENGYRSIDMGNQFDQVQKDVEVGLVLSTNGKVIYQRTLTLVHGERGELTIKL